jgi:hypothetical protein
MKMESFYSREKKIWSTENNIRLNRNDADQVLMNSIFESLTQNVSISGINQKRTTVVPFYDVE